MILTTLLNRHYPKESSEVLFWDALEAFDLTDCHGCNVHKVYHAVLHGNLHTKKICVQTLVCKLNTKGPPWFVFGMHTNHFMYKVQKKCHRNLYMDASLGTKNDACTWICVQKYNILYAICIIRYGLRPYLMICMEYKSHFCDLYMYMSFNMTCMCCVFLTLMWTGSMQHSKYIYLYTLQKFQGWGIKVGSHSRECTRFYRAFCAILTYRRPM